MRTLSTGADSTLGNYRNLAVIVFGADSPQVKFLDDKIQESPNGRHEEVISAESQMVHLLMELK
jgi:hypothetical protein